MPTRLAHLFIVLLACAAVYWPLLGANGFGGSEGHRAGPAWEMLDSGNWSHLTLFDQTYIRKPPGMPWAIAISSAVFGQTEFAARAVSALASTLMAVMALWFTNRWLGPPWGLAGGLAQALSPLFITIGRTAEIDPLNAFVTQLAAFGLVALLAKPEPGTPRLLPLPWLFLAIGIVLAGIVKGPASLPVLAGGLLAAIILARSVKPLRCAALASGLLLGAAGLGAFAAWFAAANRDPLAVTQDFSEFTWSFDRLRGTALLIPNAFLAAIPTSIAMLVLLFHQREPKNRHADATLPFARLLALTWLISTGVLMLAGVSNPRYAMPAGVLLAPLAAWGLRACWMARRESLAARVAMLGHPVVPGVVLLGLTLIWIPLDARRERHRSGPDAGAAIAAHLPAGGRAVVWADDLVEARPDVLLYARKSAKDGGNGVHPLWRKRAMLAGQLPETPAGRDAFLLLRADPESPELARYAPLVEAGRLAPVGTGSVGKYHWTLLRVAPEPASLRTEEAGGSNVHPAAIPPPFAAGEESHR
jgi:4-amino-4-deoxy-L-arabinose transferase-like glycosyltransferase